MPANDASSVVQSNHRLLHHLLGHRRLRVFVESDMTGEQP
jgi:hypothetical protein